MSILNHEVFSSSYNGQALILPEQNWDLFPVRVTQNEMQTIDLPKVLKLLTKVDCSPTTLAGLESDHVSSLVISRMDVAWKRLALDLSNALRLAEAKDLDNYQPCKEIKWLTGVGCAAGGTGTGALIGLFLGPIGSFVGGGIGLITGIFTGIFGTSKVIDIQSQKDASAHRLAWMQKATVKVDEFHDGLKSILKISARQLFLELEDLKQSNQTSVDRLTKLQELLRVFKVYFPDEEMLIDTTSVEVYLNQLKEMFQI